MELVYEILEARREGRSIIYFGELDKEEIERLWKEIRKLKEKGIVKTWKYWKNLKSLLQFTKYYCDKLLKSNLDIREIHVQLRMKWKALGYSISFDDVNGETKKIIDATLSKLGLKPSLIGWIKYVEHGENKNHNKTYIYIFKPKTEEQEAEIRSGINKIIEMFNCDENCYDESCCTLYIVRRIYNIYFNDGGKITISYDILEGKQCYTQD